MTFNKKDWGYDDIDSKTTIDDLEPQIKTLERIPMEESNEIPYKEPKEWVQELLFQLQKIAQDKGVDLLDKCTTTKFAEFLGRHHDDVWWR